MSQITQFVSNSGPGGFVQTLTGNTGGAVPPTAGNINVVGNATTLTVTGNPGTSTLTVSTTGITILTYTPVNTTPYVVAAGDNFIGVDSSGGARTVQLPNAPATGRVYYVKDLTGSAAANNITVTTVGGVVLIDGAASLVMTTNFQVAGFIFTGSAYAIF